MFKMVQILGTDTAVKLAEQVVKPTTAKSKVKRITEQADAAFAVTTRQERRA